MGTKIEFDNRYYTSIGHLIVSFSHLEYLFNMLCMNLLDEKRVSVKRVILSKKSFENLLNFIIDIGKIKLHETLN